MDENAQAVALRPPVDVMRPQAVDEIPEQTGTPERLQYSLKLDGFRALAFILEGGRVFLQSRSQRDLARSFLKSPHISESICPPEPCWTANCAPTATGV